MKNIKTVVVSLLFLICAAHSLVGQITIVLDQSVPPGFANFDKFGNTYIPAQSQIAPIPSISVLKIKRTNTIHDGIGCPDEINLDIHRLRPTNPEDMADPFYASLLAHLFAHLRPCGNRIANPFFSEGIAEAISKSSLLLLRQQRPDVASKGYTHTMMIDLLRNTNPHSWITWRDNGYMIDYSLAGGMFEILAGGDYRDFLLQLEQVSTFDITVEELYQKYLQLADEKLKATVRGQKPSQYLDSSPLAAKSYARQALHMTVIANNDPEMPGGGIENADIEGLSPIINHVGMFIWYVLERGDDGAPRKRQDGRLKWQIFDPQDNLILSGISNYETGGDGYFYTDRPSTENMVGAVFPVSGYRTVGCWIPPGASDCTDDPELSAISYIGVTRGVVDEPKKDTHFFFANGGPDHDIRKYKGSRQVYLDKRPGDVVEGINVPGMLIVKLHGQREPFLVTDGQRWEMSYPTYRNPLYTYTTSQSFSWTWYDQKNFAIANGGDWTNGYAVRGGIYTMFWKDSVPRVPNIAQVLPLPTTLDGIKVIVTADGIDYPAHLYFTDSGQINFQFPTLPENVAGANVYTQTQDAEGNTVTTNPVWVELRRNAPASFYADFEAKQPAALFAFGPKLGQLIGTSNPVRVGEYVMQFATSLGPVTNTPEDGDVAKENPLSELVDPIEVTVGGIPAHVLWAGLAPQFAGLYQINYQIPQGVPAGLAKVVIKVNGVPSKTEMFLAVAP